MNTTKLNQLNETAYQIAGLFQESETTAEVTEAKLDDSAWKTAAKASVKGDYLDRIFGICKAFGIKDEAEMFNAMITYRKNFGAKPQGYDELIDDMARGIIHDISKSEPSDQQWASIVWGLPYNALKEVGLLKHRQS